MSENAVEENTEERGSTLEGSGERADFPTGATQRGSEKPYRFGFVLTTAAGNMTRYLNLKKYADLDAETECVWAPVSHYLDPNPYAKLPNAISTRLIVRDQARPVMGQLSRLDAVMYHVHEPYIASVLRNSLRPRPLLVWSADNPPVTDPAKFPAYDEVARTGWKQKARLRLDLLMLRRTALFFPFSHWAGDILVEDCHIPADRVAPIHVGLDLELWPYLPKAGVKKRPQILFVGGNFGRKGGDLLLEVYRQHFADRADLHLVTQDPPPELPAGVSVYTDMKPNDARLRQLYADCDLFVLPTRADVSSWVALEAMATGRPVITTRTGGIPDIVDEGETGFLIPPGDGNALVKPLQALLDSSELRQRLGAAGRAKVEREFSAAVCVPRILTRMKQAVDAQRRSLKG